MYYQTKPPKYFLKLATTPKFYYLSLPKHHESS
jgi:hypothetical protein